MYDHDLLCHEKIRRLSAWQRRCEWLIGALCLAVLASALCLYW
jgi:hypothetical protein